MYLKRSLVTLSYFFLILVLPLLGMAQINLEPHLVVSQLDFKGEFSNIAVSDLDNDGFQDIVTFIASPDKKGISLQIGWGNKNKNWDQKTVVEFSSPPNSPLDSEGYTTRDFCSSVIILEDLDKNGSSEIITASGIGYVQKDRKIIWLPFPQSEVHLLYPVGLIESGKDRLIVRGTPSGYVELCDTRGQCQRLQGKADGEISELAIGDFDQDGTKDIIAGYSHETIFGQGGARFWKGLKSGFNKATMIEGMDSVDWEIGDINGDGFLDVLVQKLESISDFPSETQLWVSTKKGLSKTDLSFSNHDNHNDRACLVDMNGDGCLDYIQIGVDNAVGIRVGRRDAKGSCHLGDEWINVAVSSGIGVQVLDLFNEGNMNLVVQTLQTYGEGRDGERRAVLKIYDIGR